MARTDQLYLESILKLLLKLENGIPKLNKIHNRTSLAERSEM